jgi:hypothetical protein
MKISAIIRFVLAALFATLACAGLLFGIPGLTALWALAWLLLMERSTLTRPIPRAEMRTTLLATGVLVAALLTLPFLHLPEPRGAVRVLLAAVMWVGWMFAVYLRWRREKGHADA